MSNPVVSPGRAAWSTSDEPPVGQLAAGGSVAGERAAGVETGTRRLHLRGGILLFLAITAVALIAAVAAKSQGALFVAVALLIAMIGDLVGAYRAFGHPVAELELPGGAEVDVDTGATVTINGSRQPLWVRVGWWQPRWFTLATGVAGWAGLRPLTRGTIRWIDVDLVARGPLGLWDVGRRDRIHLPRAVPVAPSAIAHQVDFPPMPARPFGESFLTRGADDLTRGVREYRAGDPRKLVHWPATAHHGRMLVRETETLGTIRVRIVVMATSSGPATEDALGRAAWLIRDCLSRGWEVELVTTERGQPLVPPPLGRSPRTSDPRCSLVQDGIVNRALVWSSPMYGSPGPLAPGYGPPGFRPGPIGTGAGGSTTGSALVPIRTRIGEVRSPGDVAARLAVFAPGVPEIPSTRIATRVVGESRDEWR
jgi:hypothetical protein